MSQTAVLDETFADVLCDQRDVDVRLSSFATGQCAAFSLRSPTRVDNSEDCAALIPYGEDAGVMAVADGLGGLPAGDHAARIAIEELSFALAEAQLNGEPLRAAILNGIEAANRAILSLGVGSATTLAVMEVQGAIVRPYHVGDSMLLAVGQRGRVKFQSIPHSPVGYAVESGLLDSADAMHHEDRHLISNMIGSAEMHITIGSAFELASRDTVLLASDGLSDNLHSEEIIETVRKGSLATAAEHLARQALARMNAPQPGQPSKPDDLTAILFRLTGRADV